MNLWVVVHGFFVCFGLYGVYWHWKYHSRPDRTGIILSVAAATTNALALALITI